MIAAIGPTVYAHGHLVEHAVGLHVVAHRHVPRPPNEELEEHHHRETRAGEHASAASVAGKRSRRHSCKEKN